jgi:NAD(P)-dependent dehydrogenase (short-subunit alcohol dehydrogenase family)
MRELLIITGTSSGIGAAVVERFADPFRTDSRFTIELNRPGHELLNSLPLDRAHIHCDLAEGIPGDILDGVRFHTDNHDHIYLVNNAGENVMLPIERLYQTEDLNRLFQVNVISAMQLTSMVVNRYLMNPDIDRRPKLSIVNVSSVAAHVPMRMTSMYGSTKAALSQFTRNAARELASEGISVNEVRPGRVSGTVMGEKVDLQVCQLRGWTLEEAKKYESQYIPTGKVATPKEVAEAIWHLLLAPSSVTGNSYLISNGQM